MSTTQNLPSFLYTAVSGKHLAGVAALIDLRDDLTDDPLLLLDLADQPLYHQVVGPLSFQGNDPVLVVSHHFSSLLSFTRGWKKL
ncbi:hypothetical protein UFOVP1071_45 [uncultured Caudovirales phage]|uniref:Uncharacterized protein n=1 Tax=uncultured Caudovirales phage TaxID=2100421 RepID=A0A6J5QJE5_9CAUD|nr:hypothetical protein UFOVP1071_45 [uncultured Caudovirales phage]